MTYYCTQWGKHFFTISQYEGYTGNKIFKGGTKITTEEFKKLFYSGERKRIKSPISGDIRYQISGIASDIIGREIYTVTAK